MESRLSITWSISLFVSFSLTLMLGNVALTPGALIIVRPVTCEYMSSSASSGASFTKLNCQMLSPSSASSATPGARAEKECGAGAASASASSGTACAAAAARCRASLSSRNRFTRARFSSALWAHAADGATSAAANARTSRPDKNRCRREGWCFAWFMLSTPSLL